MTNQDDEIKLFEGLRKTLPQISEKEFHDFRKGIWNDILKIVDFDVEKAIAVLELIAQEQEKAVIEERDLILGKVKELMNWAEDNSSYKALLINIEKDKDYVRRR